MASVNFWSILTVPELSVNVISVSELMDVAATDDSGFGPAWRQPGGSARSARVSLKRFMQNQQTESRLWEKELSKTTRLRDGSRVAHHA